MIPKETIDTLEILGKSFHTKNVIAVLEKFGATAGYYKLDNKMNAELCSSDEDYNVGIRRNEKTNNVWFCCSSIGDTMDYVYIDIDTKTGNISSVFFNIRGIIPDMRVYPEFFQEKIQKIQDIDIPGFQIQKIETYVVLKPTKKEI